MRVVCDRCHETREIADSDARLRYRTRCYSCEPPMPEEVGPPELGRRQKAARVKARL